MTARIRVFDLECTGFTPPDHAPCEIGYCDLVSHQTNLAGDPTAWFVEGGEGFLCDPMRPIPPETSAIHYIVDADVAGLMIWPEMLDHLTGTMQIGAQVYAAHNAKFERQWIDDAMTDGAPWICTYKCAPHLWPEAPSHSNQALRYWRKPDGLDRQTAHLAHRAFPDAYVTAHLLRDMLEETTLEQLIAWSNEPALLPKIRHGDLRGQPWSEADDGLLDWFLRKDFDEDVKFTVRHEIARREAARKEEGASDEIA